MTVMVPLPIDPHLGKIVQELARARSLVLVAEPGAGKTTRVPPALLRAGLLHKDHPNLILLQPRRVAARAAAQRIADENRWQLGRQVGYHIRFEKRIGPETRLRVATEGILTRQLVADAFLEGVGAVILDEFHERSLHTDLAVALLREVRQTVRDDLILIVMSATLEAEPVAQFLGGCPIVRVPGRTFPVDVEYVAPPASPMPQRVASAVTDVVRDSSRDASGDVLVFLPGVDEIRRTIRLVEPLAREQHLLLLPLHGSLPSDDQLLALRPTDRRKIIFATNIAETSLTIDGVRTVIDSGYARVAGYDPKRGLDRLELKRISQASATQRAGRAGRTDSGRCVRLWSEKEHHALEQFELPEVRRVDLAQAVLSLHAWGKSDVREFGWYQPPPEQAIESAEILLRMLGALDRTITPLGRRMLALPIHPRLARLMLSAAEQELPRHGATLAALLSEKDIMIDDPTDRSPTFRAESDLLLRLEMLRQAHSPLVSSAAVRTVQRTRDELLRVARRLSKSTARDETPDDETLLKLILLAYPDRVARRRGAGAGVMVGGGGVKLAPRSAVHHAEFFLALDARHDQRSFRREATVHIASAIDPQWLEESFPQSIRRERNVLFDESRQRVIGALATKYLDLVLREDRDAAVDPRQAGEVLAAALRPRAREIFQTDPSAAALVARIRFLRQWMPEHPWPAIDDEALAQMVHSLCAGKRSVEEVLRGSPADELRSRLAYPLDRLLEEHAPANLTVPSGSRIRLEYSDGQPPVLAARLQELFGWRDTPRIAGGRVAVRLHLLGPNLRPVQITDDLRSFWATTYFQVRKDLRVRYPKHSWPEDPLAAKPQAKGGTRNDR